MAQLYYSPISINAAQVPSTQTNFPVLVSQTDARFKTTGNGGHVANSNGYDIRPYTDSTLGTAITGYELERYNASTGEVVMWVKVSSLTSSSTPIYLGYGDTGLTTDGSSTATWSGYSAVYHLKDGSTLNVNSATGSNNGTNHGATAAAGQIDGAMNVVSASSQYVDCGNGMNPPAISLSAWIRGTSFPNALNGTVVRAVVGANTMMFVKSNGKLAMYCVVGAATQLSYDGTGTNTLSTGTWYHIVLTCDSATGLKGYFNGSLDGSHNVTGNTVNGTTASTYMGNDPQTAGRFWNGDIDEARVAPGAHTADWITTEYNNTSSPGTFETLGTEVGIAPISGLYRL